MSSHTVCACRSANLTDLSASLAPRDVAVGRKFTDLTEFP